MRSAVWRTVAAGLTIFLIAVVDWRVELDVAFGFLYVFPLILVGTVLPRWQIAVVATLCTALADVFDPYPFDAAVSVPKDILVFSSLVGTGLFAHAITKSRHLAREAEEQFKFLVQTSPAAILTMGGDGKILLANASAHRLLRTPPGELAHRNIHEYLPALAHLHARAEYARTLQSSVECRGQRATGEAFLAEVFFSTYQTVLGARVAAVVIDLSEALRERELSGLDQLLAGSRILVGAVFHEVRNLCSAIAINYETLARTDELARNKNFEALGALVAALRQISGAELRGGAKDTDSTTLDLTGVVSDLRLVLDPFCEESGITIHWHIPRDLPKVWADRHRLLQTLLNLMRNSERALANREVKRIDVTVSASGGRVSIRVTDTGPGLSSADHLFEPFQQSAESTGLGLYLSRALLRSFGGDLRYDAATPGCSFVIDLSTAPVQDDEHPRPTHADGPHPITAG